MRPRILIVFHKPGNPEDASKLLDRLREILEQHCDCEPIFKQIAETTSSTCKGSSLHVLLLPTRGGHWLELVEKGCKPQTPPPHLLALSIAHKLLGLSAHNPLLVSLKARRAQHLQEEDLNLLTTMIKIHGLNPTIVKLKRTTDSIPEVRPADSVVPLAMLPGRHATNAKKYAETHSLKYLGPILSYALTDIASWITYLATQSTKPINPHTP